MCAVCADVVGSVVLASISAVAALVLLLCIQMRHVLLTCAVADVVYYMYADVVSLILTFLFTVYGP